MLVATSRLTRVRGKTLLSACRFVGVHNVFDVDLQLRNDVKRLGKKLGVSIKQHDPNVFDTVECLRMLGKEVNIDYFGNISIEF